MNKHGIRYITTELHLRDHLGSTRMVAEKQNQDYEVVQHASYYPFGMAIPRLSYSLLVFLRWLCVSAKTKCAKMCGWLFRMAYNGQLYLQLRITGC